MELRECPANSLGSESVANMSIVCDVLRVIVTDKFVLSHLPEHGYREQNQTDGGECDARDRREFWKEGLLINEVHQRPRIGQ